MNITNRKAWVTFFVWVLPLLAMAQIPMSNDIALIKKNKVSRVTERFCMGTCYVVETRYDERGNCIYDHLQRMGSGAIMKYDDQDRKIAFGWGVWGKEQVYHTLYEYDSCGNVQVLTRVAYEQYPPDTTFYINQYDVQCRLLEKYYLTEQGKKWVDERYVYDDEGKLIEELKDGRLYNYSYNSMGLLDEEQYRRNVELQTTTKYQYDSFGRVIEKQLTHHKDRSWFKKTETTTYTYNNKGQVDRHRAFFDDPCMGGYYLDLEYDYLPNGLLNGAYFFGKKEEGLKVEYIYEYY